MKKDVFTYWLVFTTTFSVGVTFHYSCNFLLLLLSLPKKKANPSNGAIFEETLSVGIVNYIGDLLLTFSVGIDSHNGWLFLGKMGCHFHLFYDIFTKEMAALL